MSADVRLREVGGWPEEDGQDWQQLRPRRIEPDQLERLEDHARDIFETLGMDLTLPGTTQTPRRFIRALIDATDGYEGDGNLVTAFPTECRGGPDCDLSQVIEGPIAFYSLCEHHSLPFFGHAFVGYVARENIIGISKLTRMVRLWSRRFTVQERLGQQIADLLVDVLQPHGVAVYLTATHLCTQMRGVREPESRTWTTFWRGSYQNDPQLRAEFLGVAEHRR